MRALTEYDQTDRKLHQICQILAKAGRTFVPSRDDDSHTNIGLDGELLCSQPILSEEYFALKLCLNLKDFQFDWRSYQKNILEDPRKYILQAHAIEGKRIEELETEIEAGLPELGLAPGRFRDELHFEIPVDEFRDEPVMKPARLKDWIAQRNFANQACNELFEQLNRHTEIRIWPHHFDTGIFVPGLDGNPNLGAGLAMRDSLIEEPYFYMAGYGREGQLSTESAPALSNGTWLSDSFRGAVLPATGVSAEQVSTFWREASAW